MAFDHDPSAHIFPERDQQLSRQRHDRRSAPTTAVTFRFGPGTRGSAPSAADGVAKARRAGSSLSVVVSCPIARCPARGGPTCFARASGQGRHKRRPVGGYLGVGRVPQTRGPKPNSGPTPWTPSNIGGGADALVCSALSCASRSASTALICSSSNSSRSSSRQNCASRCWGKRRPSPV